MTGTEGVNPEYQRVVVTEVREEIPGIKTFTLQPDAAIDYKAGQFLTFVFRDIIGEERRSYSLSSTPGVDDKLSITVKRLDNGKFSRPLIDYTVPGDVLFSTGAAGRFFLPEHVDQFHQFFFFAAGVGITPIYSIIKALLHQHSDKEVILIYSNTSVEDTVFYQEILELHRKFPKQLKLEFLFSSSPDLTKARLSKWLLPQLLQVYSSGDKSRQLFYTCGPFAYMRMVTITLEEAGYSREQVKKEQFDTSMPAPPVQPPDKDKHEVTLRLKGNVHHFPVQYPQTILQAARENGLTLPYSCETGRCGSCTMQCTEGKVWMSYNEVLTDTEIAEGKVLTCVGYPVNGDVVIE